MNQIVSLNIASTLTMSSREIAKLTGKQHKHVLADIRTMLGNLDQRSADFSANFPDSYGRSQKVFALPKRETLILVSGYSVVLRARIIYRWMELEESAHKPVSPAIGGALTNDDRLDALAIAVTYWVEHMARDTEKAADDHRAQMLEAELKNFADNIFGGPSGNDLRWFNVG